VAESNASLVDVRVPEEEIGAMMRGHHAGARDFELTLPDREQGRVSAWRQLARTLALFRSRGGHLFIKLASLLWPPNAVIVVRHGAALLRGRPTRAAVDVAASTDAALDWICHSQDRVGSGGVGCNEFFGWTAGYMEVTGYIIPTFWDYHRLLGRDELAERAVRMADWELGVQLPEGAFPGGYEGEGRPPLVFNTGQVIRGLLRTAQETGDDRYLDAAIRAGDWIVANQDEDGSWTTANFKGMKRVYDAYVSAALAQLAVTTGDERFALAATRNCDFVLGQQRANGWFDLCDNTPHANDAPITHTICYAVDGLLEVGELLGEERFVTAATRAADEMLTLVEGSPALPGRLGDQWDTRANYVCVTGAAQLGIILMRLHRTTEDRRYLQAALSLAEFLMGVQRIGGPGRAHRGALPGSYPVWGRYCPLALPSWTTKFFLDLLMLVREVDGESAVT
jgi:Beta-L-arabinofuranosidase, GH127